MNARINTDALVSDLKNVVRDSEQLLQAVAGATGEKSEELRDRLTGTLNAVKGTCKRLEARTKESLATADEVVREHPYQSIGIALAVGLVVGVLVTRK